MKAKTKRTGATAVFPWKPLKDGSTPIERAASAAADAAGAYIMCTLGDAVWGTTKPAKLRSAADRLRKAADLVAGYAHQAATRRKWRTA